MGLDRCQPRQGQQRVKRDKRMGSGLCWPRIGWQQVKRDMRMGLDRCQPRQFFVRDGLGKEKKSELFV